MSSSVNPKPMKQGLALFYQMEELVGTENAFKVYKLFEGRHVYFCTLNAILRGEREDQIAEEFEKTGKTAQDKLLLARKFNLTPHRIQRILRKLGKVSVVPRVRKKAKI